jgi:hypothetical protein
VNAETLLDFAYICLATGTILYYAFIRHKTMVCEYLVFLLCSLPFFWQVNEILALRYFSGFAGYIFWIPIMRIIWDLVAGFFIFKNIIL